MKIQPIVEGHGDVKAVPVLLRRILTSSQIFNVEISSPIRQKHSQLIKESTLKTVVRMAKLKGCDGIIVLFESEDDCPAELGPQLLEWAKDASSGTPVVVVLAHREYESWFLSSIESIQGRCGIRLDATSPVYPESIRGAKEALESLMENGRFYIETIDQASLSAQFDLEKTYERNRSFRHLSKALKDLLQFLTIPIDNWFSDG